MAGGKLLEMVLQASWQASVGIAIVFALRLAAGRAIPGRWLYVLWMLVLIRLVLPGVMLPEIRASLPIAPAMPLPKSFALTPEVPPIPGQWAIISQRGTAQVTTTQEIRGPSRTPVVWWNVAAYGWLVGAAGLALYFAAGSLWLNLRIRRGQASTPDSISRIWAACGASFSPRRRPELVTSGAVEAPVLLGLFHPRLVLPKQRLDALSPEDWEHVFFHELAHYQRRDTWTNTLQLATLCVHWFNPLLWLCQRLIRADRELATDERVLGFLQPARRTDYGETLLRVLSGTQAQRRLPVAIGIVESGSGMKRRLRRILNFRPARWAFSLLGFGAVAGVAIVTFGQEAHPLSAPPKSLAPPSKEGMAVATTRLRDCVLVAARAADAAKIRQLQTEAGANKVYLSQQDGSEMLSAMLSEGKVGPFVALLDELCRTPAGVDWQPSVEDLEYLLTGGHQDFIDALLLRKLDLDLLTEANTKATNLQPWVASRLEEVKRRRADETALVKASGAGDIAAMNKLLDAGVDVNCAASGSFTPLTRAAASGQAEAVKLLLARGAEVDKPKFPGWDYTPLCLAKSAEVAQLLKNAGANVNARLFGRNEHIVTYAARWAPTEVVQWFKDQRVDFNHVTDDTFEPTLLYSAGKPETAELIIASGVGVDIPNDQGETALFKIASYVKEPAKIVEVLLKHGANPNARDKYGNVPLMFAPDAETVEVLVAAGADVQAKNNQGDGVLHHIGGNNAKPDRDEALNRVGVTADTGQKVELLNEAILNKDLPGVQRLLHQGANPDAESIGFQQYAEPSPMSFAVMFGNFAIADAMRKAGAKDVGLLSQAAAQGDVTAMRRLIHDGASVMEKTSFGTTPLFFAVRQGQLGAVMLLLENGASPDAPDRYGWTPLAFAEVMNQQMQNPAGRSFSPIDGKKVPEAAAFYTAAIPLLASHAAKLETVTDTGETALTLAAAAGNTPTIPHLQKFGANLNFQRPDGLTPLMIAVVTKPTNARMDMVTHGDEKTGEKRSTSIAAAVVEELLNAGADPSIRNRDGKTALDLARERKDAEIVAILEHPPKSS